MPASDHGVTSFYRGTSPSFRLQLFLGDAASRCSVPPTKKKAHSLRRELEGALEVALDAQRLTKTEV